MTGVQCALPILGGINRGDEVILPPYTFVATPAAVVYSGAVPVFADGRRSDYTLDPKAVEAAITERPRAVICVPVASTLSALDAIRSGDPRVGTAGTSRTSP